MGQSRLSGKLVTRCEKPGIDNTSSGVGILNVSTGLKIGFAEHRNVQISFRGAPKFPRGAQLCPREAIRYSCRASKCIRGA